MKKEKKEKPISEMITSRQAQAIQASLEGDDTLLIQVCQECYKGELKALKAIELGVPGWGTKTAQHYYRLRKYLETHFSNDDVFRMYTKSIDRMS